MNIFSRSTHPSILFICTRQFYHRFYCNFMNDILSRLYIILHFKSQWISNTPQKIRQIRKRHLLLTIDAINIQLWHTIVVIMSMFLGRIFHRWKTRLFFLCCLWKIVWTWMWRWIWTQKFSLCPFGMGKQITTTITNT